MYEKETHSRVPRLAHTDRVSRDRFQGFWSGKDYRYMPYVPKYFQLSIGLLIVFYASINHNVITIVPKCNLRNRCKIG